MFDVAPFANDSVALGEPVYGPGPLNTPLPEICSVPVSTFTEPLLTNGTSIEPTPALVERWKVPLLLKVPSAPPLWTSPPLFWMSNVVAAALFHHASFANHKLLFTGTCLVQ